VSLSAPASGENTLTALAYLDVVVLVLAAPIMLLIGVPAVGYLVAAGAWIALRAVGVGVDRVAAASAQQSQELMLRMGYLLGRLFLLALTVILVRQGSGRDAGLTALAVIVFAFTMQLILMAIIRPRSRG
jgi:hypothetical protein